MKFPTNNELGCLFGNQKPSRSCYLTITKSKRKMFELICIKHLRRLEEVHPFDIVINFSDMSDDFDV